MNRRHSFYHKGKPDYSDSCSRLKTQLQVESTYKREFTALNRRGTQQRPESVKNAQQTRDTTTETQITHGYSTWHASQYKEHINSTKRYNLKKDDPPVVYMPSISDTLGYTDVFRHRAVPILFQISTTSSHEVFQRGLSLNLPPSPHPHLPPYWSTSTAKIWHTHLER